MTTITDKLEAALNKMREEIKTNETIQAKYPQSRTSEYSAVRIHSMKNAMEILANEFADEIVAAMIEEGRELYPEGAA